MREPGRSGAKTTEAVRRAIQRSDESLRTLGKRYGVNQKTVIKWKDRASTASLPPGPKKGRSTVLSESDEALIAAFRCHTFLPLDDCFQALRGSIPHLTRSSLHRCLTRQGISKLPLASSQTPKPDKLMRSPIGLFHISSMQLRTEQGALHLFVAIERAVKLAFVELHDEHLDNAPGTFLNHLMAAVPCRIHTVVTDNNSQFVKQAVVGLVGTEAARPFANVCERHKVKHRFIARRNSWSKGQVEGINRIVQEATATHFRATADQLRRYLGNFVAAYNIGCRLETLHGLTPHEAICKAWQKEPKRFTADPRRSQKRREP